MVKCLILSRFARIGIQPVVIFPSAKSPHFDSNSIGLGVTSGESPELRGIHLYLKRLEIVGFKSFADKIRLDFLPGVTGVVGPNGSGKSNISDSLRWVLGEQSIKNLRGMKMDDVIFAGSQLRKPLGLAEVTIILDNSDHSIPIDFSEISVTRKLFRSGESDYLINKSSVRLKDVQELFYDTGLGRESYSLIGQGKIDAILSAKAEERRAIFEEAAGIIKYKARKQVAERKLEETDRNLLRLQDILTEIQAQLGPLESQAALAERFLRLKEELTLQDINYNGNRLIELQAELDRLTQARAELEVKYQDFEGQESLIDSELEAERLKQLNQDNEIGQLNEDYYRIQNQIDKSNEQVNYFQAKLGDLDRQEQEYRDNFTTSSQRQQEMLAEGDGIEQELASVREKYTGLETGLAATESAMANLNQQIEKAESEEQDLKDEEIETLNGLAGLKNKSNSASLQKEFIARQLAEFQKKLEGFETRYRDLENTTIIKRESLGAAEREIAACHENQSELVQKINSYQEELHSTEEQNRDWKERQRGLESKIGLLDEMERSYQGYFQGVKAIIAEAVHQPFYQGVRGIVADLIKTKPGMELALETALGSSLQHIVIEHDRQAQEAIAYLKSQSKGRATFLPLNQIRDNQGSENRIRQYQAIMEQYGCKHAVDLLEFDPEYRPVLNYLLNQTIVAPDLKVAVQISSRLDKGFRIVTPEGDLVNPGGSITGGSVDKRRLGLLSRRKEIEDFKAEKHNAEVALAKGERAVERLREELRGLFHELELTKKNENEAKLAKIAVERELVTIVQDQKRAQDEIDGYRGQMAELQGEGERFDAGKEELTVAIGAEETKLQEIQQRLGELAQTSRSLKQEKETIIQKITELKSLLSAGTQEQNGKVALKERLDRQVRENGETLKDIQAKQTQLAEERLRIREAQTGLAEKIKNDGTRLVEQEQRIAAGKEEKEALAVRIRELENRQRGFRRKNSEYQNQLHHFELSISQKQLAMENVQNDLVEDYGAEWSAKLDPDWVKPEDIEELLESLKTELKDLGPVNLAAIDDFMKLKERYEFLNNQSQDLIKAKESLLKVIGEIERTIIKRFTETFELVRVEFKKIFSELFEGGNSDLLLIDPENPLESGIEIIAQPPGKRLQSLSLLSGGERAMTAIALLFSILEIKPSPFCILDEIDATLDEANVHRFALLLELFSKKLQFIVITHRRGTMETANALYGVTMEELGVSKLISLDLNEKKAG